MYKNLEQLITKAVTQNSFDYELKYVAEFYGDDVDKNNLAIQLNILATDYPQVRTPPSIFAIIDYFKSLSPAKKHLMDQVCTVLKLILIMPATNATSERSFSALRRLKTYLHSSMSQQRLNHHAASPSQRTYRCFGSRRSSQGVHSQLKAQATYFRSVLIIILQTE